MGCTTHPLQEARGSSSPSSTALQDHNIEHRADGPHRSRGQNGGQALGWLTSVASSDGGVCPAAVSLAACKRS